MSTRKKKILTYIIHLKSEFIFPGVLNLFYRQGGTDQDWSSNGNFTDLRFKSKAARMEFLKQFGIMFEEVEVKPTWEDYYIDLAPLMGLDMSLFSASREERGAKAAELTWNNAKDQIKKTPLLTDIQTRVAREFLLDFGAWTRGYLDRNSDTYIRALILQFIAGDIRELRDAYTLDDFIRRFDEYRKLSDAGKLSGRIVTGRDGKFFYSLAR